MTKTQSHGARLAVSTWSLHRQLGQPEFYGPEAGQRIPTTTHGRGKLALRDVPAQLAAFGISTLEICHFHVPSRDPSYLDELRAALHQADVELFSLLVDAGDITHASDAARDQRWIGNWIAVAAALGAQRVRVIAGQAPPSNAALATSCTALRALAQQAQAAGIRLMTENWFDLLAGPAEVSALLDQLAGDVGLCLDFGNWRGPTKYTALAAIAPRAESCHTKAHFSAAAVLDRADYERCLDLTQAAGFAGPYTLIYDGPDDDEWRGLAAERVIVEHYLG